MDPALEAVLDRLARKAPAPLPKASDAAGPAKDLLRAYAALYPGGLERSYRPELWAAGALHRAAMRLPPPRRSAFDLGRIFDVSSEAVNLVSRELDVAVEVAIEERGVTRKPARGSSASDPALKSAVYQLRVSLREVDPPIWRRVKVPARFNLEQLHDVLQAAFAWRDYHLFSFETREESYTDLETVQELGAGKDARKARLHQVLRAPRERMRYVYDFGDGWEHDVVLEKILDSDPPATRPELVDGERAGPPEDCGGPYGFRDLLAILADPKHGEHRALRGWLEACEYLDYRPEHFDLAETARYVHDYR